MSKHTLALLFALASQVSALADNDKWEKPSWGVGLVEIPDESTVDESSKLRWPTRKGALVVWVLKDSPAERAGLNGLDIIYAAGGNKIATASELRSRIPELGFGKVAVAFYHPTEVKGRVRFRRKGVKLEPISLRDLVEGQVERIVDEANGVELYRHRDTSKAVNERSAIDLFFVNSSEPTLQMRLTYVAEDWLFIESYRFVIDGERYTLTPSRRVERDNDTTIWEWHIETAGAYDKDSDVLKIARALADAGEAKVFYYGDQYRKEREITSEEKARIAMMLAFIDSRPQQ